MISNIEKVNVKAIIANEYLCYYHLGSILPFPSSNTMGSSHIKKNVGGEILPWEIYQGEIDTCF